MVHEAAAMDRPSIMQCLLQRVEPKPACVVRETRQPTILGHSVDHKADVDKAGPSRRSEV